MKLEVTEDNKFIKVVKASDLEIKQLKSSLKKRIKNHWFNPLVKRKVWDGYISFMDKYNRVPFGLWSEVKEICKTYDFEFDIDGINRVINTDFKPEHFYKWQLEFFENSEKKPRSYQIKSAMNILKWGWSISEIATSAGKTLIFFMVFAYLKHVHALKRMLIVVPNISLVSQTMDGFEEYSKDRTLIKYKLQAIGDGRSKKRNNVDVVIGTFQTLTKLDDKWFEGINVIGVDESHMASSKSIKTIISKCKDANIRFGMSGTAGVSNDNADAYTMMGALGPLINKIPSNYLFSNDYATPIYIRMIRMNYLPAEIREKMVLIKRNKVEVDGATMHSLERRVIVENESRLEYITNMISKVNKNTLVLFHNVKDKYGRKIADKLKRLCNNDYEIFYVDGSIDSKMRKYYINRMDDTSDTVKILVASFGTFSTGISINNLHYLFFTESFKSERIILQSIGRGMRLMDGKHIMNIIDFVDDFSWGGHDNYSLKHAYEREQIYINEKFQYKIINVKY